MVMAGLAVGRKENMGYDPDAPPSADSMTVADVEAMVAGLGEPDLAASALEFVRNLAKVTPGIAGSSGYGISGGRLAIVNDARQLLGMPVLVWDEAHGTWKEDG
jgi:hypothetical protein